MALEEYERKRHFEQTPEPGVAAAEATGASLSFVIHLHDATRLHYDLRLEMEGVLKSWAVPKGLSLDSKQKHLAVQVEDHPFDYGGFEGLIPAGQYGGGPVIVWDRGTYAAIDGDRVVWDRVEAEKILLQGLHKGKLSFLLAGDRLRGHWALVRMKNDPKNWLVIKHQDPPDHEPSGEVVYGRESVSVDSQRNLQNIREGKPARPKRGMPPPFSPMLATMSEPRFDRPGFVYEPKLDGIRCLVRIDGGEVSLTSRSGLPLTNQYPALVKALEAGEDQILDGEIVALDDGGRPSFEKLQQRMNLIGAADIKRADQKVPVILYVFDMLFHHGVDLRTQPLEERKRALLEAVPETDSIKPVVSFDDGATLYEAAASMGLEGIMAKQRSSVYECGVRSRHWLKMKPNQAETFLVCGYTCGTGRRKSSFGSLVLGQLNAQGVLVYSGLVGSGFDDRSLDHFSQDLELLAVERSPCQEVPPLEPGVRWVRPELEVEVKFAHRTGAGRLRAPVFLKLHPVRKVVPKRAAVLEQLDTPKKSALLEVDGHTLAVTNLDKELWPAFEGQRPLTKRDLLRYLARVSPYVLPHMKNRPISLSRYPNGIAGGNFYQKHWKENKPEFVETLLVHSEERSEPHEMMMCNNLATLMWMAQLGDIELHTWTSRRSLEPDGQHLHLDTGAERDSVLNYPDFMVVDLDPYVYSGKEARGAEPELNRGAFELCCQVARWFREILEGLGLPAYLKTSGKTGLHIFVPIVRKWSYAQVRAATQTLAAHLHAEHRKETTLEWATVKRDGKIFLDVNQNSFGKTMAGIFSPRPSPQASVSVPIAWDELGNFYPTDQTILSAADWIDQHGDAWSDILERKVDIASLLG